MRRENGGEYEVIRIWGGGGRPDDSNICRVNFDSRELARFCYERIGNKIKVEKAETGKENRIQERQFRRTSEHNHVYLLK